MITTIDNIAIGSAVPLTEFTIIRVKETCLVVMPVAARAIIDVVAKNRLKKSETSCFRV